MTHPTAKKLSALRKLMKEHRLDGYLVPTTDAHLSEYLPSCWQRRSWLSGFTGSAGDLIVFRNEAGLWTDGRYFTQAEEQLEGSGIELFRAGQPGVPTLEEHVASKLRRGARLGVDPRVLSVARTESVEKALERGGAKLALIEDNLVDAIWDDQPPLPSSPIEVLPPSRTGESTRSKLNRVRAKMREKNADAHVLTTLDTIAWLFNIRGSDIEYNPVVIAYAVITDREATLFVEPSKLSRASARKLGQGVRVRPYDEAGDGLAELVKAKARVWIDRGATNGWVHDRLRRCELVTDESPIMPMKAAKNDVEVAGMRAAHERDGVAMVRFLRWLEESVPLGGVTELGAEDRLEELRAEGEGYRGPSFRTISGYAGHGAIIHYAATPESNSRLRARGVYLIDSGGQYVDGTTDITRTVLVGAKATARQRRIYTLVLKGHIALACARFPAGVRGMRLDTFARMHLWTAGLDYNHGTGHGVGAYLSVHEGPQSISPLRCTGAPLEEGNILSNEPGYYEPGVFGIRIENLVLVTRDEALSRDNGKWLKFDTITLCPIDTRLIEPRLLTPDERTWLNAYHKRVKEILTPMLREVEDRRWLARSCRPIAP